ncbi:hypothetical protein GCM10022409_17050 [Hymenobacter glaciei]|uniref:Aminoglycoside phosphotransferase domain-containing protein n=1 Tax=Hymenobacter glaciei TaxID=877209 RepID=A0ABP7TYY1_9BACT
MKNESEMFIANGKLMMLASAALRTSIISAEKIAMGAMTHKYTLIASNNTEYIIRFYPKNLSYIINYEPDLFKLAERENALVPEVVYDSRKTSSKYDFIIYKKLQGQPLSSVLNEMPLPVLNEITTQIFKNITVLHGIQFIGFGALIDSSTGANDNWTAFLNNNIKEGIKNISNLNISTNKITKVIEFLHEIKFILTQRRTSPMFLWSDISPENIIINKNKLSGFIDFDAVMSGDIAMEAGYLYAREMNSVFCDKLLNKYIKLGAVSFEIIQFYSIIRLLRISKYLSQPLPNGKPRDNPRDIFPGSFASIDSL